MSKFILKISFTLILISAFSQGQIKNYPGAFSRMGFDARGIALGNSITAVPFNQTSTYYNPAVCAFQDKSTFSASYSFLDLDRQLNSICFIKEITVQQDDPNKKLYAGVAAGLLNAGVTNIDARDNDGFSTGTLSTFENQFFFSVAARFTPKFSIGASFKFYYSKLYEKITTSGFGADIGVLYQVTDRLAIAAVVKDINSKYHWDTSELYGQSGHSMDDKFPIQAKLAASYYLDNILLTAEFENSNQGTNIIRAGCEIAVVEFLNLRAGIDRMDFNNSDNGIKPSIGFGLTKNLDMFIPTLNYVFVLEPFTHSPIQMLTLTIQF